MPGYGKHSPNEMGHSPTKMSADLKYNPIDDIEKGKGEANYSGSWMSKFAGSSRMGGPQMKGSPYHNEDPPKGKEKNTSGIFGGDTIMGDENQDGNMFTRGFRTAREYMKRNFPIEGRTTSLTRPYREFSEGIDTSGDWNDKFKMETGRTKKPIGKMD